MAGVGRTLVRPARGGGLLRGPRWVLWALGVGWGVFRLMFVILCVSTGSKEKGLMAGVTIGAVVALEALFAGPITGASMNPARSIGPAVMAWRPEAINILWLYILAPVLGAVLSVPWCRSIQPGAVPESEAADKATG